MTDHEKRTDKVVEFLTERTRAFDHGDITFDMLVSDMRIVVAEQLGIAYDQGFGDGLDFAEDDTEEPTYEVDFEDDEEEDDDLSF